MIKIYEPLLFEESKNFAKEAIDSSWISSQGKYISMASEKLQEALNVKHALLVSNGTTANHLMALGLKFKNPNITRLIVPSNVYVAAWNQFIFDSRAKFDLEFIDARMDNWNINDDLISSIDKKTTAFLAVHNLGSIINVHRLYEKFGSDLIVLEDNCEGFLGSYEGFPTGSKSLISTISFFGNKNITCGEGGAIVTNDTDIYEYLKSVYSQYVSKTERYIHDDIGFNYRMTNIQAAILYGQLLNIEKVKEIKNEIFLDFREFILNIENLVIQSDEKNTLNANWILGIRKKTQKSYSEAFEFLEKSNGIETRPIFYPASKHKYLYTDKQFDNSDTISKTGFMIPSHPNLTKKDIDKIKETLKLYIENNGK